MRKCFECEHSRQPTRLDILHQMNINKGRGWPTKFASLDCMDWKWENSSSSMGRNTWEQVDNKSIVLEVIQSGIVDMVCISWHVRIRQRFEHLEHVPQN